ncbi:MAG: hypothetical protein KDE09_04805 [Anaerolineales bacterium]|nr:hypothetical protein [Anaerolineales bacterium]MCB0010371.1 hypothetical protein [Anaerolineales bacterium]MCB0017087.1 hypothetical protein [Anaerolineales bacterium]MCB0030640.1 hypothetical protein [Anaerolineales bacterium]MCB8960487.1 hypothetical protein [Ardenticatenales bacterium]
MSISVIVHIANEEPALGEIEELPKTTDNILVVHNPRKMDGRDLPYLADEVTTMVLPWHRIIFLEIMPSDDADEIIGFVRD